MQSQHADSHDAIAAQLRDLATRRAHDSSELHDPSELNVTPAVSPEPVQEPAQESANEPLLRATPLNDNTSEIRIPTPRERSGRGVVLLAVCAGVAATMAWHSYGDEAKQRLSHLVPQLFADGSATQSANAAESKDAASQIAASQPAAAPASAQEGGNVEPATPPPAAPAAATPTAETPPTQAALPPELTKSIETMSREIASLKQTVEQLQAGQQQLSHDVAKVSEHRTRHNLAEQTSKPASRPRPLRTPTPAADSRTLTPYSPPQSHSLGQAYPQGTARREAYIPPPLPAPTRLPPQPGDSSVPRPPMPVQ